MDIFSFNTAHELSFSKGQVCARSASDVLVCNVSPACYAGHKVLRPRVKISTDRRKQCCAGCCSLSGLCTLSESPTTTAASPLPSASPSPPVPLQSKLLPSASNSACSSIPFLSLSQPVHSSEDTGDRVNKTCHDTPADTTAASSSARSAKVQQVAVCRTPSAMSSPQSVEELLQWFLDVPSPPADYPFSIFSFIRAAGGGIGWARQLYGELGLEEELFCAGAKGRRAKALSAIREEHRDEKETPCSCASGDTPAKEEEEEASTLSCGSVISTFSSGARTIGSGHTFGDGPTNVAGPQSLYGSPGSSFLSSTKQAEEQDGSTARQGGDGGGCVTQFASRFERCFHVGGGTGEEDEDENPLERRGLGKFAGEWFGPATASTAVKLLVESMPQTKVSCLLVLWRTCPAQFEKEWTEVAMGASSFRVVFSIRLFSVCLPWALFCFFQCPVGPRFSFFEELPDVRFQSPAGWQAAYAVIDV